MTTITIAITDDEVSATLDALAAAMEDMTLVMDDLGELLLESTKQRFIAGEAPDGTPWAPKSATTMAAYAKRGDPIDPRPLFGPSRQLSSQFGIATTPTSVEISSSLVYAATMQFGAQKGQFGAKMGRTRPSEKRPASRDFFVSSPWGDIPARPFLGLSDDDSANIIEELTEWLDRVADGA